MPVLAGDKEKKMKVLLSSKTEVRNLSNIKKIVVLSDTHLPVRGAKIPEQIIEQKKLIVNSSGGEMAYGDHYVISSDGWSLTFKVEYVSLSKDQIIELYVYEEVGIT